MRWMRAGHLNLRGKKSLTIMAGKYVEDVLYNKKEDVLGALADKEAKEEAYGSR